MRTRLNSARTLLAVPLLGAMLLSGCVSGTQTGASEPADSGAGTSSAESAHSSVTLAEGWAKAGSGMTGVFGTLMNPGSTDLTIEAVESSSAGMVELHEVTSDGVMQEISGEVVIPAGESLELMPGGTHIMLMQMPEELLPGDEVSLTIRFTDGTSATVAALVKEYAGANEEYEPGEDAHGDASREESGHDAP